MALSQNHNHNFSGDFLIPSFHGNSNLSGNNYPQFLDVQFKNSSGLLSKDNHNHSSRTNAEGEHSISRSTLNDCDASYLRLAQRCKANKLMCALKDKIIGENVSVKNSSRELRSEQDELSSASSCTMSNFEDEEDDDQKTYRNDAYTNDRVIDSLKEKYVCLNFEFNQLQARHGEYVGDSKCVNNEEDEVAFSDSSDNALERKYTQIFHCHETPSIQMSKAKKESKKHKSHTKVDRKSENKENVPICKDNKDLKLILKTLKKIFKSPPPVAARDTGELKKLYEIVKTLQEEQEKFRNIIKEQQDQLNNFHSKYLQAQNVIQSQKYEIKQLHNTNAQLESELTMNMDALKEKIQDKINEVSHLPRAVKAEKSKCDKLSRENCTLISKVNQVKQELALVRTKFEDANQKRAKILNKLKAAERDLKIFRAQNNTLKTEKRTLFDELRKLKGMNDDLKTTSSKNISRQKERGETQQRLLRKKIIDLELELTRSRNSTNVLVEERDKLIAELHMQLNTLVHNFEISQKHIRILRRHIYSLSGSQILPEKVASGHKVGGQ